MRRRIAASVLIFLALAAAGAKKIFELAAAPNGQKQCDFVFPLAPDESHTFLLAAPPKLPPLHFLHKGGTINDASCLNKTPVSGVVDVRSEDDLKKALQFARENHLVITPAGARHSMGGQSFARGGLVLDMRNFKRMELDEERTMLIVESGALWKDVQKFLDAKGFAVKAMQSINIFTVGGTLSVNAHGIAHNPGPVAETVRSIRILLPSGEVKRASRSENAELFRHALGGYGLFGIILDAELEVVKNEMYQWKTDYIDYRNFAEFYEKNIRNRPEIGLAYGRLSVSPFSYLRETAVHTFHKTSAAAPLPALSAEPRHTALARFVINFSKTGRFGKWLRWTLEKALIPGAAGCISRNAALAEPEKFCLVSRNQQMYDSMEYLKNRLPATDILQEYFVSSAQMPEFVDGLRRIVALRGANLLNVTIRMVSRDRITALPYAQDDDMFAFVLYFNQKLNAEESERLAATTRDLIDLVLGLKGTFYLPYQLVYSPNQLRAAYPMIDEFFAAKRRADPEERLMNAWYEKYGRQDSVF